MNHQSVTHILQSRDGRGSFFSRGGRGRAGVFICWEPPLPAWRGGAGQGQGTCFISWQILDNKVWSPVPIFTSHPIIGLCLLLILFTGWIGHYSMLQHCSIISFLFAKIWECDHYFALPLPCGSDHFCGWGGAGNPPSPRGGLPLGRGPIPGFCS